MCLVVISGREVGERRLLFLGESFPFDEEGFGQMSNTVTLLESQ
jgi:hypothetical protein